MAFALSGEPLTDRQAAYADYRRRWAEEVAVVVPTAQPFPKRRPSAFRIKPEPGTDEETDPQD